MFGIPVTADPLGGGVTFGAPGIAGYGPGKLGYIPKPDPALIDYVDRGDPVGNFASDAPTPEPGIAQPNSDHVGTVYPVPSDTSEGREATALSATADALHAGTVNAISGAVLNLLAPEIGTTQIVVGGLGILKGVGGTIDLWKSNHVLEHYPTVIPNIKFDPTAIFKPTGAWFKKCNFRVTPEIDKALLGKGFLILGGTPI